MIDGSAWPSILETTVTGAPAWIASDAAVCRSPCGVMPGTSARTAAASKHRRWKLLFRMIAPVPIATLRWYRHRGIGPKTFRLAGRVVAYKDDVDAWISQAREAESNGASPRTLSA